MAQIEFDEDAAAALEALYVIRDALRRRALVREALAVRPGESVLDVGCGPGFYCAELADVAGPEGAIVGVDSSTAMLALAARRCAGHANVDLREGEATSLPAEDGAFDAALSVQVFEYLADPGAGLAELHRVLRPGGRVLLWDVDWATASMAGGELTTRVLAAWDEHLADPSLPRTLSRRLRDAGFEDVELAGHAFPTAALDPETYGGGLVPFIGGFVAGRGGVSPQEAQRWIEAQRALDEEGRFFFCATQFCFTARKPQDRR